MASMLKSKQLKEAWKVPVKQKNKVMAIVFPNSFNQAEQDQEVDPEVEMMQDLISSCKADGTIKQYLPIVKDWKQFAGRRGFNTRPATTEGLSRFIARKSIDEKSLAFFNNLSPALVYDHESNNLPGEPPVCKPFVKNLIAGAKRKAAKNKEPTRKADCISKNQIHQIIKSVFYDSKNLNWIDCRTAMKIFVMYKTFCRFDCYSQLTTDAIKISSDCVEIVFRRAKNDQFYSGSNTYLAAIPNSDFCPVKIFKRFFAIFNFHKEKPAFLNCRIRTVKGVSSAIQDKQLSYTTSLENSKALLQKLNILGQFSEKTFKVAGVSEASNQHVSLEDISSFGRWKNIETPRFYMDQSKKRRMEVSTVVV